MRIFLQSASVDDIREHYESGLVDGIALTYTDLAASDPTAEVKDRIADLERAFAVPIAVPVAAVSGGDIYRDGRELARASDRVIVQVPFMEDAVTPIRRLVADGVGVCATYIYSGAQAFLAAKIGATTVRVQVDDIESHGQRGGQIVSEIRDVIDQCDLECDLEVAAPCNSQHFTECLLAGADTVSLTPAALRALTVHSLTDRGVDRFLSDLSKRHKPRGA